LLTDNNPNFALTRFLPNGQLDPTFGSGGFVNDSFYDNPGFDVIFAMAMQPWDGKFVVVGHASPSGAPGNFGYVFAIGRYNPDGSPDLSFGGLNGDPPGKVSITFTDDQGQAMVTGRAYAVAIQDDHRIVVGGTADFDLNPTQGGRFALARLDPDGRLDP